MLWKYCMNYSSHFNLLKSDLKSAMVATVKLNFAGYSRVSAITSSLLIFLRAISVSDLIKKHNSRLLTTNFYYSVKNTSARFGFCVFVGVCKVIVSIFSLCIYDDKMVCIYDHIYNYDWVVCTFLRLYYYRISNVTDLKLILTYSLETSKERWTFSLASSWSKNYNKKETHQSIEF